MNDIIWIKTENNNYYKLINKLNNLYINVYEIKKTKKYVFLKISLSDYIKVKKYIISYKFTIDKKTGINYFFELIHKNLLFFIISLSGLIFFLIFNNVIIDIQIIHEKKEIKNIIKEELLENNLKPLTFKKSYQKINKIKEKILQKYPDKLDWLEIENKGMKYIVRAEERIITKKEEKVLFCDVYAKKNGVITGLNVLKGVNLVTIGDYVKEGDLLITGNIVYNESLKTQVCAEGIINAERWYEVSVSLPLEYFIDEKSGKSRYNLLFQHLNYKKRILRKRIKNSQSSYKILFDLFNYRLYLEKEEEIIRKKYIYDEKTGLQKALLEAENKIKLKLKANEKIISKKVLKKSINDSKIDIEVFIVTEEIIN